MWNEVEFHPPVLALQEFLSKAPAPKETGGSANIARGIVPPQPYLTQPSTLPELKPKAGLQVSRQLTGTLDKPASATAGMSSH